MRHIVNFSGGACSFWVIPRVIAKMQPGDTLTVLMADTLMEDEDLYRFVAETEAHFGLTVTVVKDGRSPWDLFEEKGMLGNSRFPLCSVILKREVLDAWRKANCVEFDTIVYVGIDWTESHRLEQTRSALPDWRIEAPMCEAPFWDKCRMLSELLALGIQPPRLYDLGFPHNNCGGFCVKAGQAHFAHLLKVMPERYAFHEAKEEALRARTGKDYSILNDRRGDGKKKTLTLRSLRQRIEAGESFDRDDWGGCGCSLEPNQPNKTD